MTGDIIATLCPHIFALQMAVFGQLQFPWAEVFPQL